MMIGIVNAAREATLRLSVSGPSGQSHDIEAVIDTGFSGSLTLPPSLISALGLPWLCRQQGLLADGSIHIFDVYVATVLWDGQPRQVEVESVDAAPLLGMDLLQGCELRVHVIPGGSVAITVVP
jgi:clan AA aspartic protease